MKANDFLAIAPMFASEDESRPALLTPFRHGHHLFVTDGRIALVGDASGLDADGIFETPDLAQRRIGDSIIKEHIEAREKDICCGKYHGYGLCNIGEAVCFYARAISDAATGRLVHKRSDGEVNIDALRFPSTRPTPTKGGEQ